MEICDQIAKSWLHCDYMAQKQDQGNTLYTLYVDNSDFKQQ